MSSVTCLKIQTPSYGLLISMGPGPWLFLQAYYLLFLFPLGSLSLNIPGLLSPCSFFCWECSYTWPLMVFPHLHPSGPNPKVTSSMQLSLTSAKQLSPYPMTFAIYQNLFYLPHIYQHYCTGN